MFGILITVLGVWVGVSIALAWALGRWFRWLRGDFDPTPTDPFPGLFPED